MNRLALTVVLAALLLLGARSSLFVVHRGEYAAVYSMGRVARVQRQPGLYFKWPSPVESVVFIDARLRSLRSGQSDTFATAGKHNAVVRWFVKWRVVDPAAYLRAFAGSESAADDRLATAMRSTLDTTLQGMQLQAVLQALGGELPGLLRKDVGASLRSSGVEVVDAGLTQLDYAADATEAVYSRMATARSLEADQTRAQGQVEAARLRAEADRKREVLLAQAYRKAQVLKGEGDAEAAQIDAQAFGKDPEFASFYRSLEAYRATLDRRSDLLVLDPSSAFFRYLRDPYAKAEPPPPAGRH